jgi:hypothetical protein
VSTSSGDEIISDSSANTVESAVTEAGSQATASESGGTIAFTDAFTGAFTDTPDEGALAELVDPASAHLNTACTLAGSRGTCSGNQDTITFNACGIGTAVITGSITETFTGSGASSCTIPLATGNSVTRTSSGTTVLFASGATLVTDTSGGTAWDGTVIPSSGTTISKAGGTRTIVINGTHRKLSGPKGRTWFDHFLTSSGLTTIGTRAGGDRIISGTVTLYHNLAKYTATNNFNSVMWGSSTCCYPTNGSVTTTFTGAKSGSGTMTFTSTCGAATYVDATGSSNVTLTQCH